MSVRLYYRLLFRLEQSDAYMLWFSDIRDGIQLDTSGAIPFGSEPMLRAWTERLGVVWVNETPILHDLDALLVWLEHPTQTPNCRVLLSGWNLLLDVATSLHCNAWLAFDATDSARQAYNKLFAGNNLPAITSVGEIYTPVWTPQELKLMAQILSEGMALLRAHLVPLRT